MDDDEELRVDRTYDLQRLQGAFREPQNASVASVYEVRPHPLSRLLVPDAYLLAWTPFAWWRALRLTRGCDFDCVITTSPPESAHFIGRALAKRGVPWIADLRDGWAFEPHVKEEMWPTRAQHRLNEWLEQRLLRHADAVTAVTSRVADDLRRRLGVRAEVVPNGWGEEHGAPPDGGISIPALDPNRVSVVFTGRLAGGYKDPAPVIQALRQLAASDPRTAGRLELVFAGSFTEAERKLFETDVSPARIRDVGRLDREGVYTLQRAADAGLLITSPRRSQESGSKLFEYIGAGLPILALARPDSAAAEIVATSGGLVVDTHDIDAIATGLVALVKGEVGTPDEDVRHRYSWPVLTERMVEVAGRVVRSAAGRHQPPGRLVRP
jgi:glycosyltransferase involved in cell wall biosynthesis